MRKKVMFAILFLFLMLNLLFVLAEETSETALAELDKIEKAYQCLEDKIDEQTCEALSIEEKIFSLLAVGECKNELIDDSRDEKCWPKSRCDTKTTAQAILALDRTSFNTGAAEDWLLSQNTTLSEIIWYLQIESNEPTTCIITYAGSENVVDILEDKTILGDAGYCLAPSSNGYWLQVKSVRSLGCYEYKYYISCEDSFLTTLLFQKPGSSTIHVSEKATSAAAEGTTTEKIDSFCFMQEGLCDYEASLWAAFVLDYLEYDVSGYMPFLVTMQDEYEQYLPEVFLYLLTGYSEFRNNILLKQKINKYWMESGDKYYDTALALYPFKHLDIQEKTNSKTWLLENQDREGCWEGNIRNTAFILHSLWQDDSHYNGGGGDDEDCSDFLSEDECLENGCEWDNDTESCYEITDNFNNCEPNYGYCMPGIECDGIILSDYDCSAPNKCCSVALEQETCNEQGGIVCSSNQECSSSIIPASDVSSYETCCASGGYCRPKVDPDPTPDSQCKQNNGICRTSCYSSEETADYDCTVPSDDCCVDKTTPPIPPKLGWLWVLLVLIVLVVLGIVFKDKLRPALMKIKSKFSRKGGKKEFSGFGRRPPGSPPGSLRMLPRRPGERRIIPSSQGMQRPSTLKLRPKARPIGEVDDVLKKLKEMSK